MPNKAYLSGRRFEYRVANWLRQQGWWVMRSAQSRGLADLAAFRMGEIMLLSLKVDGYLPPKEKTQLIALADENGVLAYLVLKDDKRQIKLERLN